MGSNTTVALSSDTDIMSMSPSNLKNTWDHLNLKLDTLKTENDLLQVKVNELTIYKEIVERVDKNFDDWLEGANSGGFFSKYLEEELGLQKKNQEDLPQIIQRVESNLYWLCKFVCNCNDLFEECVTMEKNNVRKDFLKRFGTQMNFTEDDLNMMIKHLREPQPVSVPTPTPPSQLSTSKSDQQIECAKHTEFVPCDKICIEPVKVKTTASLVVTENKTVKRGYPIFTPPPLPPPTDENMKIREILIHRLMIRWLLLVQIFKMIRRGKFPIVQYMQTKIV